MTTIYLDLDGTVLDVQARLYSVYRDSVIELGGMATLSMQTYWLYKREHVSEEAIARCSRITNIRRYMQLRWIRLEAPVYLRHDKPLPYALDSIAQLGKSNRIVLTTMRVNEDTLYSQLARLGISLLLDNVLLRGTDRYITKAGVIMSDDKFDAGDSIIVGDTERDILAGRALGIRTIAVSSGIRSRGILDSYHPDAVVENIGQLLIN